MFQKIFVLLEGFGIGYEAVTLAAELDHELILGFSLLLSGVIVMIAFIEATPNPPPLQRNRRRPPLAINCRLLPLKTTS